MDSRGKRLMGVLFILISVTALIAWEKWGKNQFLYDSVLVLNQDIDKGTVVEEHMLTETKMDLAVEGWIGPEERDKIIGSEAAFFMRKGIPLFPEYFNRGEAQANRKKGTYILSVPTEWINSVPKTLSKGHWASFFQSGKRLTAAYVTDVSAEEKTFEVVVTHKQAEILSAAAEKGSTFVITYY